MPPRAAKKVPAGPMAAVKMKPKVSTKPADPAEAAVAAAPEAAAEVTPELLVSEVKEETKNAADDVNGSVDAEVREDLTKACRRFSSRKTLEGPVHLVTARALRLNLPPTSPLLYNTLIHSHTAASLHSTTIHLFLHFLLAGARPNEFTFPFVLKSSALLGLPPLGRQIHTVLLKTALLHSNIHCAGALLDLYSKLAPAGDAHHLFDSIPDKNVVFCITMISAYTQAGACRLALELLSTMEEDGFEVDVSSWSSVVAGCVRSGDAELALDMLGAMLLKSS